MPRIFDNGLRLTLLICLMLSLCGCFGSSRGGNNGGYSPSRAAAPAPAPAPKRNLVCLPGEQDISPAVFSKKASPRGTTLFPAYFQEGPPPTAPAVYPDAAVEAFAKQLSRFTMIVGAAFDAKTDKLMVVGEIDETKPPIDPDDFFVAFRAASQGQETGVTIDPGPDTDNMVVKHFGNTEDTHHGYVTYAADLFMKVGGFLHDNHSCQAVDVAVAGFQSEMDRTLALPSAGKSSSWHRFWAEPSVRVVKRGHNNSKVLFDVKPHVKTEHFGGDASTSADEAAKGYADFFTHNYEAFEQAYPVFYRLRQLYYMDTLVKWLTDYIIPVDQRWFDYQPKVVPTPRTVPAVTVVRRMPKGNFTTILGLYGGITFHIDNSYETTVDLGVMNNVPADPADFQHDGGRFGVAVLDIRERSFLPGIPDWTAPRPQRLPSITWVWEPRQVSGQARATFVNGSRYPMNIQFKDTGYSISLPVGGSRGVDLPPGSYTFYVTAPGSGAGQLAGELNLQPGQHSTHQLSIVTHKY